MTILNRQKESRQKESRQKENKHSTPAPRHWARTGLILFMVALFLCVSVSQGFAREDGGREIQHWARQLHHSFKLADKNLLHARSILKAKTKIALTPKQEEKIETIMMAFQETTIRKSAEIKIRELRFASFIESSQKIEKKEMARHIREIGEQKTDWVVAYINYLLDLRDVLTPKQLQILKNLKEKVTKKRKHSKPRE